MMHESLERLIARRFAAGIAELTGEPAERVNAQVRPAGDPQHGDYQCNAAMALARPLAAKPRDVAERIKAAVEPRLAEIAAPLEIAGPGFINIRLTSEFLASYLAQIPAPLPDGGDRFGLPATATPQRVVVDYSQPNIAKQMHVGHLRSTIIGDVLARVLAFAGHTVIRQNHIGDWGTQFGILIRWYREQPLPRADAADILEALDRDYAAANARFKADEAFAGEARRAVAELQGGEAEARRIWEYLRDVSLAQAAAIYERLGVLLQPADICGESFYNAWLPEIVTLLRTALPPGGAGGVSPGMRAEVRDDAGAVCVFMYDQRGEPLFKNRAGEVRPTIVQKSDGAYNYETTDLAGLRYRIGTLGAQRILYVVDEDQGPHFDEVFAIARAGGIIPPGVEVVHVKFGKVLGSDGKPLRTRAGGTVKLRELLDEAERRAQELLVAREETARAEAAEPVTPKLSAEDLPKVAERVGIAAVKYADLRNDRSSKYVFDWDKMISFQGNTAPYMMYAYARVRSIYRKTAERLGLPDAYAAGVSLVLAEPTERTLGLRLARLCDAIEQVAADLSPHTLCAYLYDLAGDFMRFYETCPVLAAADEATRLSRLRLCDLTARALRLGLGLLGIEVLERM
jgi:arginyl-tRNA synthetase